MRAVSAVELGRRIIELLDLKKDESFEIARTRDGQLLVAKAEAT